LFYNHQFAFRINFRDKFEVWDQFAPRVDGRKQSAQREDVSVLVRDSFNLVTVETILRTWRKVGLPLPIEVAEIDEENENENDNNDIDVDYFNADDEILLERLINWRWEENDTEVANEVDEEVETEDDNEENKDYYE
jgi:hypothetical protein